MSGVALQSHHSTGQVARVNTAAGDESYLSGQQLHALLILAGVDTLELRRHQLTKRFFTRSVLPESSCLHYLLPDKRDTSVTGRLRQARTFQSLSCRTVKFQNSFIPHCLFHYD